MSYSCRSILDQIDVHAVDETWRKCEEVLTTMSSFSLSARNSLQFLQVTHQHIVQNYTGNRIHRLDLFFDHSLIIQNGFLIQIKVPPATMITLLPRTKYKEVTKTPIDLMSLPILPRAFQKRLGRVILSPMVQPLIRS